MDFAGALCSFQKSVPKTRIISPFNQFIEMINYDFKFYSILIPWHYSDQSSGRTQTGRILGNSFQFFSAHFPINWILRTTSTPLLWPWTSKSMSHRLSPAVELDRTESLPREALNVYCKFWAIINLTATKRWEQKKNKLSAIGWTLLHVFFADCPP